MENEDFSGESNKSAGVFPGEQIKFATGTDYCFENDR